MARKIFVFDPPDRFVCGTVGQPGSRTFFLQAVQGPRVISVELEKVQVAVLVDRMAGILGELERRGMEAASDARPVGDDDRPLDEPLREQFRVATLTIGWDMDEAKMVVEARSESEEETGDEEVDDSATDGPDVVRVRLGPDQAVGFVKRSSRVLAAGRPPCPLCGQPLNPEGHICPRTNGYVN